MDRFGDIKLGNWHCIVTKVTKGWHGSDDLKLQCIRNCHVLLYGMHSVQHTETYRQ